MDNNTYNTTISIPVEDRIPVTITFETIAIHRLARTLAITLCGYRVNPDAAILNLMDGGTQKRETEDTPHNRAALQRAIELIKTNEVLMDAIREAYPNIELR